MIETKTILNSYNEKIFVEVYIPNKPEISTIVFCHGITGCRKGRHSEDTYLQDLAKELMNHNFRVVLFDFSGHGDSGGEDYDVTISKSESELALVVKSEVSDLENVSFLAFSYGAAVLDKFLSNTNIIPKKVLLYSPCIYPIESCFLNEKSIFGKDIVKALNEGTLQKNGYTIVGVKNFKFGYKMIEECRQFQVEFLQKLNDKLLVFFGKNDVILNTKYNEEFCNTYNIKKIYYNASHSLYEEIENVSNDTIAFFKS